MKKCNVYEILQYIAKGGFIVFVSDTRKREIRLISHNGGERVGRVSENTFQALLNSGIVVEGESSTDKYGTKYCPFTLVKQ